MIQVKDRFISIKDIKQIRFSKTWLFSEFVYYLIVEYMFNEKPIEICVDGFDEYIILANEIKDAVNEREEK